MNLKLKIYIIHKTEFLTRGDSNLRSICVFGDSIAKGVVLDNRKNRYTYIKDNFMNIFSRKSGIRTENYAKFGCDVIKGSKIISNHISELSEFDNILVEFGGNDCNFNWNRISEEPEKEHIPSTPIASFKEIYTKMIEKIRAAGSDPIMMNLPPLVAEKFFAWVSKGNNAGNILKWLGDVDHIFRWHRDYNDAVCEIAEKNSVPLIDIRSAFTELGDYSEYICEDGMHTNLKGHRLIADRMLSFCCV